MATVNGIEIGFKSTNMVLTANMWAGVSNVGEIGVSGTTITKTDDTELSLGDLGSGVACSQDGVSGDSGYLMYSVEDVHTRFSTSPPHVDGADHLVFVRYNSGWYYDTNSTDVAFTPVSTDLLVATVTRGIYSVVPTILTRYWVGGTGNWSDITHWAGSSGGSAPVTVDSYTTGSDGSDWAYSTYTHGQSFTGNGGTLYNIYVNGNKTGSPTGNVYVKVYAHSGTYGTSSVATGAALATSDAVDISKLSTSASYVPFSFTGANRITLTNGTHYVFLAEFTTGTGWENSFVTRKDASSPTHAGNKTSSGGAESTSDMLFYVYSGSSPLPLPTSSDDVFIDANSGFGSGGTITFDGTTTVCHDLTCTSGHSYTMDYSWSDITVYGSVVLESGLSWSTDTWLQLYGAGSETITTNGSEINYIYKLGAGTYTLLDDLIVVDEIEIDSGTFDVNDFDVTTASLSLFGGSLYMGSGEWTFTTAPTYSSYIDVNSSTYLHCETSTMTVLSDRVNFFGGGATFYDFVWGSTCDQLYIYEDQTFYNFTEEQSDNYHHAYFTRNCTTTFTGTVTLNGISTSNPTTIQADAGTTVNYSGSKDTYELLYQGATPVVTRAGESFNGTGCYIHSARVNVRRVGSITGNVYVKIYAHSGTYGSGGVPTGEPIATSSPTDVTTITDGSDYGYTYFYFYGDQRIQLVSETKYFFAVEFSGGGDTSNCLKVFFDNTSPTYAGNGATYVTTSGWTASGWDISGFSVYDINTFTLSKSSGTVDAEHLDLSYSAATGGATWIATNSLDTIDNDGWLFYADIDLTLLEAGTTALLTPTVSGDANSDLAIISAGSVVTLSPTTTGDASVVLSAIALSIAIPEVGVVGVANVTLSSIIALTTLLIEPTVSVERKWGENNNNETNWADSSPAVTTDWTSHNDSSNTWTPVDTLRQS